MAGRACSRGDPGACRRRQGAEGGGDDAGGRAPFRGGNQGSSAGLAHAAEGVRRGSRPGPAGRGCSLCRAKRGRFMKVGLVCPYGWDVPGGVQEHIRDPRRGADGPEARGVFVTSPAEDDEWLPDDVVPAGRAVPVPCIEECAVERICEGERMLYIHPDECVDWAPASRSVRSRRSSAKTMCPTSDSSSPSRTPNSSISSARPAASPRPACCPATPSMSPTTSWSSIPWCPGPAVEGGGGANADPAASPPAEEATATTSMRGGPGTQVARLRSALPGGAAQPGNR
jgi:hypothetical protein